MKRNSREPVCDRMEPALDQQTPSAPMRPSPDEAPSAGAAAVAALA